MDDYIFGANILENLTTGMYKDSKVIYREYIQNACDQIDKAIKEGILQPKKGSIDIWTDKETRTISIEDNATGIKSSEFRRILGNIADSDKRIGEDKGFRGIGRLCGLAYCKELVFTSTYKGECEISTMRCDAQKMRELIIKNEQGEKITASEVLNKIITFEPTKSTSSDSHWFKVEMIGINNENTELLDVDKIIEYLSFVAPVPYQNTFIYRKEIYGYAKENGFSIDEYKIRCNAQQIFKQYSADFKTSKGDDSFHKVAFEKFKDDNGNLLAWMWVGVSTFKAVIQKEYIMRGLRLRKENIQIGSDDALQHLFKEDRGPHYFIGEVFAVSKNLIPNSQRDYFNENPTRQDFENILRRSFMRLKDLYYAGSELNSSIAKIKKYNEEYENFEKKKKNGEYVDDTHLANAFQALEDAKSKAEEGRKKIESKKRKATEDQNEIMISVISHIENSLPSNQQILSELPSNLKTSKKATRRTDKLSSYSKNERKLINRIFGVILRSTDESTAEIIIKNIEDDLQ